MKFFIIGLLAFIPATFFIDTDPKPESKSVETVEIPEVESSWVCNDCTPEESYILAKLQEHTRITDRNALATILGNIKQESKFVANICEGGARVPYNSCLRGGYGIVQWTSTHRYLGLGYFAKTFGCDPSEFKCQVRYMINEPTFQRNLPTFQGGGQTVSYYMRPAYRWLGWGIKGNRESYAYDYSQRLTWS
mgnify:CR=1 FL=1|tara:strand:+ start:4546 stop:5121 length:576 start_codon:yes stop_codon:yes gene_type:complete